MLKNDICSHTKVPLKVIILAPLAICKIDLPLLIEFMHVGAIILGASPASVEDIAVFGASVAASDGSSIRIFEFKKGLNIRRSTRTAREAETSFS